MELVWFILTTPTFASQKLAIFKSFAEKNTRQRVNFIIFNCSNQKPRRHADVAAKAKPEFARDFWVKGATTFSKFIFRVRGLCGRARFAERKELNLVKRNFRNAKRGV